MPKLISICPRCNKKAHEVSHQISKYAKGRIITLSCGHNLFEKILDKKAWEELGTFRGKKKSPRPYQGEAYEFARESGFRCLIADDPGIGKTIETLLPLRLHGDILYPCLIVVKSALKRQYAGEVFTWLDVIPDIIESSDNDFAASEVTIITYDMLNRIKARCEKEYDKECDDIRKELGLGQYQRIPEESAPLKKSPFAGRFQTLILDECQQIRNQSSKRAQCVREIAKDIPHILASSGTPIQNHAGEYFTILNILRPEMFYDYKAYVYNYCDWYEGSMGKMKIGGLRDPIGFKEKTKDFIIRRTKEEVLKDLPKLDRKFVECDFQNQKMKDAYAAAHEEFLEAYNDESSEATHILAKMSKLRHISGLNKVPFCAEFITDFLNDTNKKIVVFTHHLDVADMLTKLIDYEIRQMNAEESDLADCLVYSADKNSDQRENIKQDFIKNPRRRVLIGATKSIGEGVDGLQDVCEDFIMLERQWNPKVEEQCEARFVRSGSVAQSVSGNYLLTTGTIDEFFTNLLEIKRANVNSALDGKEIEFGEQNLMKELADILARKGSKAWKLI